MPKVSICIPAYNQIQFLEKTLNSILIQSFKNFEIIIADDSPVDSVRSLVKKYDFGDKLKYYQNKPSLGSPKNWNFCISKATGDYIKIMHHDDWFSSDISLERLVNLLESGNNAMAFCGCNNISIDDKNLFYHSITTEEALIVKEHPDFLYFNNRIGSPSVTIFKKNNLIFDEKIKYLVDSDYYIRLLKINPQFSYTKDALVNVGHGTHQVTNSVIHDKDLLIYEYSYEYQKLKDDKANFKWHFYTFWNLFKNLNIQSTGDLIDFNWQGSLPKFVTSIIKARAFMKRGHAYKVERQIKYLVYLYSRTFYASIKTK
jgi:glycosyltransferase involved in cell wall biosynthesis